MKNTIIYLLIVLFPVATKAQDAIYEKSDSILIEEIIKRHTLDSYRSAGELAIAIAEEFEGMEYVANTLDNTKKEQLFISCDKLDCTTFVELVAAMTITVCNNENKFADVCRNLENIRYRDGIRNGYQSRLHYFSWWIDDNRKKRIVEEVTADSPHRHSRLYINYMSSHPDNYRQLKESPRVISEIEKFEIPYRDISISYIPKDKLNAGSNILNIKNGDIIALVTTINGLDVTHVGFAFWKDEELHLMHASSKEGKVIKDKTTLYEYQKGKKSQTGIRVIRIQPCTGTKNL